MFYEIIVQLIAWCQYPSCPLPIFTFEICFIAIFWELRYNSNLVFEYLLGLAFSWIRFQVEAVPKIWIPYSFLLVALILKYGRAYELAKLLWSSPVNKKKKGQDPFAGRLDTAFWLLFHSQESSISFIFTYVDENNNMDKFFLT